MTRLILTRHGETEWNLHGLVQGSMDSPLTDKGLLQAAKLAERLKSENISCVYSSTQMRAVQTARVIADRFGLQVLKYSEFGEICFGTWEGKAWREIRQSDEAEFLKWEEKPYLYTFPGGENMQTVLARAKPRLRELCEQHPDETICVVSHGITLKVLVTDLMGLALSDWMETPWQSNTALNIFEITGQKVKSIILGDSSHIL